MTRTATPAKRLGPQRLAHRLSLLAKLRRQSRDVGGRLLRSLPREHQMNLQRDEPVLGPIVQLALESPALGGSSDHDAHAGAAQLVGRRFQLCLQANVLRSQRRRRPGLPAQPCAVRPQSGCVHASCARSRPRTPRPAIKPPRAFGRIVQPG